VPLEQAVNGVENSIYISSTSSSDGGTNWTYSASVFQPIGGGQRGSLLRLREGPLFFAGFGSSLVVTTASGGTRIVSGLYAALSYDNGVTITYDTSVILPNSLSIAARWNTTSAPLQALSRTCESLRFPTKGITPGGRSAVASFVVLRHLTSSLIPSSSFTMSLFRQSASRSGHEHY
jgi:hypothetical protein